LAPDSRRVFPRAWLVAEAYLFDGVHAARIAEIEERQIQMLQWDREIRRKIAICSCCILV
jgi:sirohydrochlorin ferrochelatase